MLSDIKRIKMRAQFMRKIFFYASNFTLVIIVIVSLDIFMRNRNRKYAKVLNELQISDSDKNTTVLKFILQWTSSKNVPFDSMGAGQEGFIKRNCRYTNCFVTSARNFLANITDFHVIAFAGPEFLYYPQDFYPETRASHQKYVFASIESADYYPVCSNKLDGFFNWTWTFRLDSDVRWGYLVIKDMKNNIIGPKKVMHWLNLKEMKPVSEEFKQKLKTKTKAAAWFVSNCLDKSGRFEFAQELEQELLKHNLQLDTYGYCGKFSCPRRRNDVCMRMLERTYFFHLSFENSIDNDYVTEKLTKALQNNVVPIVYGGANYTRFMPEGIYLNARELGVERLASKMAELIKDPEQYANYFKWKNHYSYHNMQESPETNEYCQMCALLNDEEKMKQTTVIKRFWKWWDGPIKCYDRLY